MSTPSTSPTTPTMRGADDSSSLLNATTRYTTATTKHSTAATNSSDFGEPWMALTAMAMTPAGLPTVNTNTQPPASRSKAAATAAALRVLGASLATSEIPKNASVPPPKQVSKLYIAVNHCPLMMLIRSPARQP